MVGKALAQYQITEKLGEGGMGAVWKARDTHLDRFVALKTLPAEKLADPERKRRFVQEAKAASGLNHPNIVHIYDIAESDGVDFIAMELVAGKTLDQLILRKGLPLNEALKCAVQIADALATAHSAGIIHRDLKPANIMMSGPESGRPGLVKVLDFGLAKLTDRAESTEIQPTETIRVDQQRTEEGAILGTVGYMSPEQAQGKKVDARSDIFSFGSVLYEMITGRRAFHGETKMSTLAAVIDQEPKPIREIAETIPRDLEKLITRCLRKDPSRRFQHMDDVLVALEELKEESDSGKLTAPVALVKPARRWRILLTVETGLLVAVVLGGAAWWAVRKRTAAPVKAPSLSRLTSDSGLTMEPAISPDGKMLAYASDRSGEGNLDIWVQQITGGEPLRLTRDPADDHEPEFSPDGGKIAFRSERDGGGIYLVSMLGGESRLIAKGGHRPRFSPDGNWIAYAADDDVYVVAATGGAPRKLAPGVSAQDNSARSGPANARFFSANPVWSPDGKQLLFEGSSKSVDWDWWVAPLEGGTAVNTGAADVFHRLGISISYPNATPVPAQWLQGRILFSCSLGDSINLWQIPISTKTSKVSGAPQRLTFGAAQEVDASAAADGRIVFATLNESINIWSLPLAANQGKVTGAIQQLTHDAASDYQPSISADGKRLVFVSNRSGNPDLWIKDLDTERERALTQTPSVEDFPRISRDGTQVTYQGLAEEIFIIPTAGGIAEKVCDRCLICVWDWSADAKRILGLGFAPLWTVRLRNLESKADQELLRSPKYTLHQAQFSPEDRWIAFGASSGRISRIYVAPFRSGGLIPESDWISISNGYWDDKPRWSPDGNLLYFTSDRDGSLCIWARRLEPAAKKPVGPAFEVYHFASARRSLKSVNLRMMETSVARDKMVMSLGDRTGNIWMTMLEEK